MTAPVTQAPTPPPSEPEAPPERGPRLLDRVRALAASLLAPGASLLVAAAIGAIAILLVQRSAADVGAVAAAMWDYGIDNPDAPAFILSRATPLILAGLATALAFKGGLFNIGVEGQYAIGALVAAVAGSQLALPAAVHLPVTILAGMAGGCAWALIPALLKAYRGAHEVISTIMMNYLANGVLLYLLAGALRDPAQPEGITQQQTEQVRETAQVGSMVGFLNSVGFDVRESAPLSWLLLLALAGAVAYGLALRRTRFGFDLRVIGLNPRAAEPAGILGRGMLIRTMLLSGAIAGLAGLQDVLFLDQRMGVDYVRGYGFTGIAIALLGRNSASGIVAAALLFAFLDRSSTGIGLNTEVPNEVTTILQGVIILTIVVAYEVARRLTARRQLRETHERA